MPFASCWKRCISGPSRGCAWATVCKCTASAQFAEQSGHGEHCGGDAISARLSGVQADERAALRQEEHAAPLRRSLHRISTVH